MQYYHSHFSLNIQYSHFSFLFFNAACGLYGKQHIPQSHPVVHRSIDHCLDHVPAQLEYLQDGNVLVDFRAAD
jgi:hypothetical protein